MKYCVTLPVVGAVSVFIDDADSEEDAIEKALDTNFITNLETPHNVEVDTLELMRRINTGNVCHAPCWEAKAELEDDND